MNTQCWIDLFDQPTFQGERRRFFGPTMIDAVVLGTQAPHPMSFRVGRQADVRIVMADGRHQTVRAGEAVDSLDTRFVRRVEVKG